MRCWGQWLDPNYPVSGLFTMAGAVAVWGYWMYGTRSRWNAPSPAWLLVLAGLLLAYAGAYATTPRLVSSTLAVLVLSGAMLACLPASDRRAGWGFVPWMLASLPLGLAVNAYFGFPLRLAVGYVASLMLPGQVESVGTGLSDGVHTVFVDAPCSGVQMLRISVLVAGGISVLYRLTAGRVVALCVAAVLLAFMGNTLRVCLLFQATRRGWAYPWLHEWIGVGIFIGCCVVLVYLGNLLIGRRPVPIARAAPEAAKIKSVGGWYRALYGCSVVCAILVPFAVAENVDTASNFDLPWPASIAGEPLSIEADNPLPEKYRATFLGTAAQGRLAGGTPVLLRQCAVPTLTLHSTEACYRALGYTCTPLPAVRDAQGHLWSRFKAERTGGHGYAVRQCFFSMDAELIDEPWDLTELSDRRASWPDVASWYWAAARPGAKVGTTLAVALAEPLQDK